MVTLGEALAAPDRLPDEWLLFAAGGTLSADSPCLVADLDQLPDGVDLPAEAAQHGLTAEMDVRTVRDIVNNLLQQTDSADTAFRVRAFAHYVANDAFIALDRP